MPVESQPAFLRGRGRGRGSQRPPSLLSIPQQTQPGRGRGPPASTSTNGSRHGQRGDRPGSGSHRHNTPQSPSNRWFPQATGLSHPQSPGVESERLETSFKSVEDLFAKARMEHFESAQKHVNLTREELDDSEDEEEDIGSVVLNGVFQSYAKENGGGDVQSAQENLLHSFRSGTSACLVCIETIKKEEAIWSCEGCYCMFHIQCIQKWVREGVYMKQVSSGDFETNGPTHNIPWFCPKCRHEYSPKQCPSHYYCFCGKERDPKFDPWLVPHSCGNVCGKKLKPECGHSCLLLCHPGACPPCPVMVKSKCYCGKSAPKSVRCSARSWACQGVCGRKLSCNQHTCPDKCHPGECKPCSRTSIQPCCCGKQKSERPCDSTVWRCDQPCGKALSCGNHVCEQVCHSGPCGKCPRSGLRKCPCGKTEFQLPCTEDIPTCGDTCGKPLTCGQHFCTQRCHTGECGQCRQMAVKKCRCGQRQKELPCSKEWFCDKKCNKMRDCGVHKCNRKCCDGNCPSCEQTCGKTLKCRNHKCASRCHKGPCYPCRLTVDIFCHCKATKVTVPCGRERQTKPPRCNLPCRAPSECHHPARQKHRCHFGDCPPCTFICSKLLQGCSHLCPLVCHDSVKTRIEDKSVKAGPWEERPVRVEKIAKPCPPCQVSITVQCLGKHETSQMPCSQVRAYSCGRKCGRHLACGNHTCQLECHVVTGADDETLAGQECQACERGCEAPRPKGCTHACLKPCHPAPCPPCRLMIRMRCHCQSLVKHIPCDEWVKATSLVQDEMKSCGQPCPKEMPCGHPCGVTCHSGQCPNIGKCERKVTLKCACKRKKEEMTCKERASRPKPSCDDNCKTTNKTMQNLASKQKEEEEKKKQEAELQEYERMMKGRKKKPRRQREEIVEETFWSKYKLYLVVIVLGLVSAVAVASYIAV